MRVVRDVSYLQGANYADDKDKLDLYLPEGRDKAPVIVSYYGNQLMGGDKAEDAFVGQRFASAGFVTVVVNYRVSPGVSHPAHAQDRPLPLRGSSVTSPSTGAIPIACFSSAIPLVDIWSRCCRPTSAISPTSRLQRR